MRPPPPAQRSVDKALVMENLVVIVVLSVVLCSPLVCGDGNYTIDPEGIESNATQINLGLEDVEVPDSALTYMEMLRSRKVAGLGKAKKKQQSQNTTTPKPDDDDDDEDDTRRCNCSYGICKCCTGYVLDLFNQKACMQVTYHPGDFAFDVAMSMNDRVLYESSMSGKNPKPICINPPRLRNLKVCAKFYNVFFPGRNFHFCLAMTGQFRQFELFNMAFDCLRMGANGIAMVKPEENGGIPVPNPQGGVDAVIDAGEDDIEEYDENNVKSLFDLFDRK